MTNIIIKPIASTEWQNYKRLRLRALTDAPEAFGSDVAREQAFNDELWQSRLRDNIVLGGYKNNKLCAMAGLMLPTTLKTKHKAIVWGMYVAPEMRSKGVGRMLLEVLVNIAKGCRQQLHLSVVCSNAPAVRLYQALGFEIYGTEPCALKFDGQCFDEYLMVLKFGL